MRASASEFGGSGAYGCEDTVQVAAKAGVDYKIVVDGCMRRDRHALHTLFWLTSNAGFDAASSQGHAAVLGNILRFIGDGAFGTAMRIEPAATRENVQDQLRYDFGVGESGVKEEDLAAWYPLTFGKQ